MSISLCQVNVIYANITGMFKDAACNYSLKQLLSLLLVIVISGIPIPSFLS